MPHDIFSFNINHLNRLVDFMQFLVVLLNGICYDVHSCNAVAAAGHTTHFRSFDSDGMEFVDQSLFLQLFKTHKMVENTWLAINEIVHHNVVALAFFA